MAEVCCHCNSTTDFRRTFCSVCRKRMVVNDRFVLTERIGGGGTSKVYRALDRTSQLQYAIKVVDVLNNHHWRMIEREVSVSRSRLDGLSFVPTIYGAWQHESDVYIVMEFISGLTLDKVEQAHWIPRRVHRFLYIMLSNLSQLHQAGVIHRDIKPQNIKRTDDGKFVLLDFGIAKTDTQSTVGGLTPQYAPIEQLTSQTTSEQTDLFSLGVTAYELLTKQLPPTSFQRLNGQSVIPPSQFDSEIADRLERTILRLMELDAANRPSSAASALKRLGPPPARPQPLIAAPPQSNSSGLGVMSIFVVLALIVGVVFLLTRPTSQAAPEIPTILNIPEGRLVFSSNRSNAAQFDLYLADADGGSPINLTKSEDSEYAPAWSGDGRYVAYVGQRGDDYVIGRYDIQQGAQRYLTRITPGVNFGTPAPSPDGRWIAYNSGPAGDFDLYLMTEDGVNPRLLVRGIGTDYAPAWLPDNRRMVYINQRGDQWSLATVDIDGVMYGTIYTSTDEKRFTAISPDGKRIAFSMERNGNWDVYTIPVSGGIPQRVTSRQPW